MASIVTELKRLEEVYFVAAIGPSTDGDGLAGEWAEPNDTAPMERERIVAALRGLADTIEQTSIQLEMSSRGTV